MKPGYATTEFAVAAGTISSILSGVISSEHSQIIVTCAADAYIFGRVILKAIYNWKR